MQRGLLPTPALVLDLDALERNLATMMAHAAAAGVSLRPHAKSHKCVEIARRLQAAGALGPACATIAEAEAMAEGGLGGILITSPMVSPDMLDRVRRLVEGGADLTLVVDHLDNVAALAALAEGSADPCRSSSSSMSVWAVPVAPSRSRRWPSPMPSPPRLR